MQLPITRELGRLWQGGSWHSFLGILRFVARIIAEGRGNELFYNALREIEYAPTRPYDERHAVRLARGNIDDFRGHLASSLARFGYRWVLGFSSQDEDKCVVSNDLLICKTPDSLRFYDMRRRPVRSITLDGSLGNFVCLDGRVYFVVDGKLFSTVPDGKVRNEALTLSSPQSIILDQGIATDGRGVLVVAEYKHEASGESGAFLYIRRSTDEPWQTIDTLARKVDKHCHIVVFDPGSEVFYVTCGDNHKMLWALDTGNSRAALEMISAGASKTGGYMCAAPWAGGLVCGTDYTGGTNFLVLVRRGRICSKEALRKPFRRGIVTSIDTAGSNLLFSVWNMGYLPTCRNGLLLRSTNGTFPICYSDDPEFTFELFPSADALVVRAGTRANYVYEVFHRS